MVNGVIRVILKVLPWIRHWFIIASTLAAAVSPLFPRLPGVQGSPIIGLIKEGQLMRSEALIRPACLTLLGALAIAPFSAIPQVFKRSVMLEAMESELARSMEQLKKQPTPPYFLSYEVTETESTSANGSFGALVSSSPANRRRILCIDLRVGSYNLDNTRPVRGLGENYN